MQEEYDLFHVCQKTNYDDFITRTYQIFIRVKFKYNRNVYWEILREDAIVRGLSFKHFTEFLLKIKAFKFSKI